MWRASGWTSAWLDVTGCEKLFGSGEEIATKIRETVKAETGLTISVGVSFTKVFAKLGQRPQKARRRNHNKPRKIISP